MTPAEFDALTHWGPERRPPRDWDGVTPFLLRDGTLYAGDRAIRAYLLSDGTRLLNEEDRGRGRETADDPTNATGG